MFTYIYIFIYIYIQIYIYIYLYIYTFKYIYIFIYPYEMYLSKRSIQFDNMHIPSTESINISAAKVTNYYIYVCIYMHLITYMYYELRNFLQHENFILEATFSVLQPKSSKISYQKHRSWPGIHFLNAFDFCILNGLLVNSTVKI
jgi:hypothetical protein